MRKLTSALLCAIFLLSSALPLYAQEQVQLPEEERTVISVESESIDGIGARVKGDRRYFTITIGIIYRDTSKRPPDREWFAEEYNGEIYEGYCDLQLIH